MKRKNRRVVLPLEQFLKSLKAGLEEIKNGSGASNISTKTTFTKIK
jgi:hypothetical protein